MFSDLSSAVEIDLDTKQMSPEEIELSVARFHCAICLPCVRHGKPCNVPTSDLDVTGTPCLDYCSGGKQERRRGSCYPILVCYCSWLVRSVTSLFVHENSSRQHASVLGRLLKGKFVVFPLRARPAMVGFKLIERDRMYLIGANLDMVDLIADPTIVYDAVVKHLSEIKTEPCNCYFADLPEVREEVRSLCKTRRLPVPPCIEVANCGFTRTTTTCC